MIDETWSPSRLYRGICKYHIDIQDEILSWQETGIDESKYGLDIQTSIEISRFLEELKEKNLS